MNGMMRGHLKLMILNALEEKPMSGSELIKKLEEDVGWKPSCGSVYPILNSLGDEALTNIKEEGSSTKKIYSLTKKGREEMKKHNSNKKELMEEIAKVHRMIESTYGVKLNIDEKMMDNLKSGRLMLGKLHKESEAMRKEFMALISEGLIDSKSKEIKKIMTYATAELRKLRNTAKSERESAVQGKRGKQ